MLTAVPSKIVSSILSTDIAFIFDKVSKPVILGAVFINGFLYTCRNRDFVIKFNDLFGTFDYSA